MKQLEQGQWICKCGKRHDDDWSCICGRRWSDKGNTQFHDPKLKEDVDAIRFYARHLEIVDEELS